MAPALDVGDAVPHFTLPCSTADELDGVFRLVDVLDDGPLLLAFYPLAFTGVCTAQVCDLRDHLADLTGLGVRVYGFSIDSPAANQAFARAQGLAYPLISDPNREVVERIWETQRVVSVDGCAKRGLLLVDGDGIVRWRWITDDADQWVGAAAVRAAVRSVTGLPRDDAPSVHRQRHEG